jgi:hypothetical protein
MTLSRTARAPHVRHAPSQMLRRAIAKVQTAAPIATRRSAPMSTTPLARTVPPMTPSRTAHPVLAHHIATGTPSHAPHSANPKDHTLPTSPLPDRTPASNALPPPCLPDGRPQP